MPMLTTLIITGGIATGKSTFGGALKTLAEGNRVSFFDADASVHELLTRRDVTRTIGEEFGSAVIGADGAISRPALREAVFARSSTGTQGARKRLEAILHPLVRDDYRSAIETAKDDHPGGLFIADIPLYFESEIGAYRSDRVAVVACSPEVQRERVLTRGHERGVSESESLALIAAQRPIMEKVEAADYVVWNDGNPRILEAQATYLMSLFPN